MNTPEAREQVTTQAHATPRFAPYLAAAGLCVVTTVVATALTAYLDAANTIMLFLLTVAATAVYLGRGPAVLAAVCSVALFDFFFVPPRFSFNVNDVQYVVTFAVMLAVALIISHLTGGLKLQAVAASQRERETRALYDFAKRLAGAMSIEQVSAMSREWLQGNSGAAALLLARRADGAGLEPVGAERAPDWLLLRAGETVASTTRIVATDQLGDDRKWLLLPLDTAGETYGVLAIGAPREAFHLLEAQRPVLEALASVVTSTLERLHYVDVAQGAEMRAATERLRSSVLSAISHDVRTPLTTLYGLADRLSTSKPPLPEPARESALAIRDQSQRLCGMVSNLLDMARLQAGEIRLRKEWQPLEEVIGASLQSLGAALREHPVKVELEPDLPLLHFDAVLIERVFGNLVENAAKYAPAGTPIVISAHTAGDFVQIAVSDAGPGFPPDHLDRVFELFTRVAPESSVPGMGVGLAICEAIVRAHGGDIRASNLASGGACVTFSLPRGTPPLVSAEPESALAHGR